MAIHPPEQRLWWKEPVARGELVWIGIAFVWGLIMFFTMVYWHLEGEQNLSNEAYKIDPFVFAVRTETWAERHIVREEGDTGIPVVRPPGRGLAVGTFLALLALSLAGPRPARARPTSPRCPRSSASTGSISPTIP